jgi:hypothetical protein
VNGFWRGLERSLIFKPPREAKLGNNLPPILGPVLVLVLVLQMVEQVKVPACVAPSVQVRVLLSRWYIERWGTETALTMESGMPY